MGYGGLFSGFLFRDLGEGWGILIGIGFTPAIQPFFDGGFQAIKEILTRFWDSGVWRFGCWCYRQRCRQVVLQALDALLSVAFLFFIIICVFL